jgi:hypothetical protein
MAATMLMVVQLKVAFAMMMTVELKMIEAPKATEMKMTAALVLSA